LPERARGALGLAILWIACRAASGFDGLYGQDAHEYLRYATALRNWLLVGVDPGYSPWPPAFPMSAALLSLTGISVAMSTQMVSFLSWLAAYWFGALALERLHPGRSAAAYWAGPFALSPFLMRIALSSMSDMLAIAWECACLAFGLRWLDERRPLDMALATFCLACGAATRFSVADRSRARSSLVSRRDPSGTRGTGTPGRVPWRTRARGPRDPSLLLAATGALQRRGMECGEHGGALLRYPERRQPGLGAAKPRGILCSPHPSRLLLSGGASSRGCPP
jgi:hypothetical protein